VLVITLANGTTAPGKTLALEDVAVLELEDPPQPVAASAVSATNRAPQALRVLHGVPRTSSPPDRSSGATAGVPTASESLSSAVMEERLDTGPVRRAGARGLPLIGLALACSLVFVVGLPTSASGSSHPAQRLLCSAAGGRTLSKSAQVRVFAREGVFYSCWLPTRRRTTLGTLGESVPDGPPALATHVRIDGQFVAFSEQAFGDPGYDVSRIVSVNARTGRVAREVEPQETENFNSFVIDVGVAADDAVVYLQETGTPCPGEHTSGDHGPDDGVIAVEPGAKRHTLDCELPAEPEGSISKLVVKGQTATWMHAGVLHTATLR